MLNFLKKNAAIIITLLVAAFAIFIWSSSRQRALQKLIAEQEENYELRIQNMREVHETQLQQRDAAIDEYMAEVQQIEEEHERQIAELEERSRQRIEDILSKAHDDPEYIEELFRNTFNL